MVHRAILGSYERFIALLLEHFVGAFPLWLSPVQVQVIPISEKHNKYASDVFKTLKENDIRVELIDKNETISKKIREGETKRVPYLLIVGDQEKKNKSINVRERNKAKTREMKIDLFIKIIKDKIEKKS